MARSLIPTPHTVYTCAYETGAVDDYGNDVESWGDPVPQKVHGWAPAGSFEETDRERSVTAEVDLLCPAGFAVGPFDRVIVAGVTYEVDGEVRDYTNGPFGFEGGIVVSLKRWS